MGLGICCFYIFNRAACDELCAVTQHGNNQSKFTLAYELTKFLLANFLTCLLTNLRNCSSILSFNHFLYL